MEQYFQLVKRWWWLLVLLTALGAAAGYVVSRRQAPVYEATTTLLIAAGEPSPELAERLIPDQRSSLVKTYRELLLKRPVLEAVIADLGLSLTPEELAEQMAISEVRDTQILALSAQDSSPERAALIANATVAAFNRQAGTLLANPYATGRGGLSVVEAATPPLFPTGAGALRTMIIAAMVGLLLAGGVAFAAEYLDTRVRSESDVAQLTGLPTIVEIGALPGREPQQRLVTRSAPDSQAADVYRMVRLMLEGDLSGGAIRNLIVTSPDKGEGKSLTAANLAIAMSQTGLRTVLIDANLRRPIIHELFDLPNMTGVATAMRPEGVDDAYAHTVESGVPNLRLMLSGPLGEASQYTVARMLTPNRMHRLMQQLSEHADIVIFDSPSVLEVIETALLARSCDASVMVVESGRTEASQLLRAREALNRARVDLLGVVLNQSERSALGLLSAPQTEQALQAVLMDGPPRRSLPLNGRYEPAPPPPLSLDEPPAPQGANEVGAPRRNPN